MIIFIILVKSHYRLHTVNWTNDEDEDVNITEHHHHYGFHKGNWTHNRTLNETEHHHHHKAENKEASLRNNFQIVKKAFQ
jgi:hypothetical protein